MSSCLSVYLRTHIHICVPISKHIFPSIYQCHNLQLGGLVDLFGRDQVSCSEIVLGK